MAIWQNWWFGHFEGWKKVEIGLFSWPPMLLATELEPQGWPQGVPSMPRNLEKIQKYHQSAKLLSQSAPTILVLKTWVDLWPCKKKDPKYGLQKAGCKKKQGHCYSKREKAALRLLFLNKNDPAVCNAVRATSILIFAYKRFQFICFVYISFNYYFIFSCAYPCPIWESRRDNCFQKT